MSEQKRPKLHRLITEWPRGVVQTTSHLRSLGYSSALLNKYKKSRWILPVGRGAWSLCGDEVDWIGALYALQTQLGLHVHAGGKTALEMMGYAHYLTEETRKIFLYGQRGRKLPAWFREFNPIPKIIFKPTNLFPAECMEGFSQYNHKEFSIRISSPERAALEMLYHISEKRSSLKRDYIRENAVMEDQYHVPGKVGYGEASLIMENLYGLRPEIVGRLLDVCNFIKVKRLFMYMAEEHNHSWVDRLDLSNVDFGRGKRVIVMNGVLDKKYNITVPETREAA